MGHMKNLVLEMEEQGGIGGTLNGFRSSAAPEFEPLDGVKYDSDKPRMELIPPEALWGMARVLTSGAHKYSDRNWEKGMEWSRVYGALQRHLLAWWGGELQDSETGESHLHHAACCIAFLQTYEQRGVGKDDRSFHIND